MFGLDAPDALTRQEITISFFAWWAIFALSVFLLWRRSWGFRNRAVSFLHAVVALVLCPAALDWRHPFSGFGEQTTASQVTCSVSCVEACHAFEKLVKRFMTCSALS